MKCYKLEDGLKCKIIHDVCKKMFHFKVSVIFFPPQPSQLQIWQAQLESNQSQSYRIHKYGLRPQLLSVKCSKRLWNWFAVNFCSICLYLHRAHIGTGWLPPPFSQVYVFAVSSLQWASSVGRCVFPIWLQAFWNSGTVVIICERKTYEIQ